MGKIMTIVLSMALAVGASAKPRTAAVRPLAFDASKGEARVMAMPDGSQVR